MPWLVGTMVHRCWWQRGDCRKKTKKQPRSPLFLLFSGSLCGKLFVHGLTLEGWKLFVAELTWLQDVQIQEWKCFLILISEDTFSVVVPKEKFSDGNDCLLYPTETCPQCSGLIFLNETYLNIHSVRILNDWWEVHFKCILRADFVKILVENPNKRSIIIQRRVILCLNTLHV